ncbi:sensor histidine kinase [Agaricicola taiwanensis]|nr:ATP-binding protein [Agaricicola taiwanensis]
MTDGDAEASIDNITATSSFDTAELVREIRERMSAVQAQKEQVENFRRRDVAVQVREARERLTSTTGTRRAFDLELIRVYARNRFASSVAIMALAICVASIAYLWSDPRIVTAWFLALVATLVGTGYMARRFLAQKTEEKSVGTWWGRFTLAELVHGLVWSVIIVHLAGIDIESSKIFVFFVMLLVIALSTMMSATLPAAVYATALPVSAAVIGFYTLRGDALSTSVALLTPLALAYFLVLGRQLFYGGLMQLQHRAEKDALIAELEQAKANSDEARRRAEEANLAKSRFLATMSHELRTPLNAILGFSEVMKSEVFGAHAVPTYREYAGDIHQSGEHLLNLINEILDLSRIEAGRYELNEDAVALAYIAEDCHHLLKLRARNRGATIRESFELGLPMLWADERAIRQITLNLLSNAIKFTPQGGEILMTVGRTGDGGQFLSVRDTGPGIPEDEIPIVLSSFGQGTLAMKTAEQGAGLGLPIVKGLVDLHGGSFELRSKLREGTEAIVRLPASRVMTALAPVAPEEKQTLQSFAVRRAI